MKVTSFLVSKKLAEIKFEFDFDYCYRKDCPDEIWNKSFEMNCWDEEDIEDYYPAYDLETILEVLPESIHDKENCSSREYLQLSKDNICYRSDRATYPGFSLDRKKDESLTDCAARLLILLHKKGLINFK